MDIVHIISLSIILAVSIGLHEYAHAWTSFRLGDPTPKLQWRLTPNPLAHLDPIGFLLIFIIGFGWGKPVQINPTYYKNPKQGELLVALAGPATNILLTIIWILVLLIYSRIVGYALTDIFAQSHDMVTQFWMTFGYINVALAVFNMLPIPPLDGFRLVKMFAPSVARLFEQYAQYIAIIFLVLILLPGTGLIGHFISSVSSTIFTVIYTLLSHLVY